MSDQTPEGTPATSAGTTRAAGAGESDEQMVDDVVGQTDKNLLVEPAYKAEGADVPSAGQVKGSGS